MKSFIKKNIVRTYLLDAGFVLVLGLFLLYARTKLGEFLALINSHVPQINSINTSGDEIAAEALIKQVGSIASDAYTFLILIPVIVFLIYLTFQGANFYYLNKKRLYLVYFLATSLISYALFILFILKGLSSVLLFALFIISSYLTFLSYLRIDWKEYLKLLKKSYIFFPVFLGYAFLWLVSLSMFFMALLNYSVNESYLTLTILGLLFLFFVSAYRIWFMKSFSWKI